MNCPSCGKTFKQTTGLMYHISNNVCGRPAATLPQDELLPSAQNCSKCGKSFKSAAGLLYHENKGVCSRNTPTQAGKERAAPEIIDSLRRRVAVALGEVPLEEDGAFDACSVTRFSAFFLGPQF